MKKIIIAAFALQVALLLIPLKCRAASFDTTRTEFYYDSIAVIRVFTEKVDCSQATCEVSITDGGTGTGARFPLLSAMPGDTLEIPYNFPRRAFNNPRGTLVLYFFGPDAKVKAVFEAKLISPPTTGIRAAPKTLRTWKGQRSFRIDGRLTGARNG